jgi:hypothetical protein
MAPLPGYAIKSTSNLSGQVFPLPLLETPLCISTIFLDFSSSSLPNRPFPYSKILVFTGVAAFHPSRVEAIPCILAKFSESTSLDKRSIFVTQFQAFGFHHWCYFGDSACPLMVHILWVHAFFCFTVSLPAFVHNSTANNFMSTNSS